jgi:hypothetical protein
MADDDEATASGLADDDEATAEAGPDLDSDG